MADLWTYREEIKRGRAGVASEIEELDLDGFSVEARDGDVGKVDGAAYDDGASYLVVDTGPLFLGQKIVVPGSFVRTVDTVARRVELDLDKEQVENAPEMEEERLGDAGYRTELGRHYEGTPS